ncbi:NAD(P)H-dependent oxidoreductase [Georgenia deserti]|uniref:NAD(P)H-dependent oxidoreductase n=1 Tax=Georgenia deserti TaxID=2093781 RepID=A0ABW4L448_9MICO
MSPSPHSSTILWVFAHPEPASLNGALRRAGQEHLRRAGHEVLESDLYAMDFDPVLRREDGGRLPDGQRFAVSADTRGAYLAGEQPADLAAERSKLDRADAVVVQFPLWWYGVPAILKGWFDRVLVSGFAFGSDPRTGRRLRFEQGPFTGKRALVVTTLGDRPRAIGPRGKSGEITELLFGLLHGTFAYTGMGVLRPWALPSADRTTDDAAARESLVRRLDGLFDEETIPYRPQFTGDYTAEWELADHVRPGETGLRIHVAG